MYPVSSTVGEILHEGKEEGETENMMKSCEVLTAACSNCFQNPRVGLKSLRILETTRLNP
jgi:hypothetical protein